MVRNAEHGMKFHLLRWKPFGAPVMRLIENMDNKEPISVVFSRLQSLLCSDVYQKNLAFWHKAWNGVKQPYTQMPDLSYLPSIPTLLKADHAVRVLDLGCGSGWLSIYLAREGFAVTGVDIADHALELAQMWAKNEDLSIKFDIADLADMKYEENAFDGIVANSIFEHLTYDLALGTMLTLQSILKPGGIFIGCFDKVGTGPGEYFKLEDGTQVYTDKGRSGMMLRCFSDDELKEFFSAWQIEKFETLESGSRFIVAKLPAAV
jgi:SAM-dependent methyltransferase